MIRDNKKHVETMIGEDAVITGEIVLKGGAIISGKVMGSVKTSGIVRITRTGIVKGDMEAGEVMVGGTVHGDIVYKQLVIEEGASFEGRCDIATNQQSLENAESQPEIPTIQEYPEKPDEESSV